MRASMFPVTNIKESINYLHNDQLFIIKVVYGFTKLTFSKKMILHSSLIEPENFLNVYFQAVLLQVLNYNNGNLHILEVDTEKEYLWWSYF